MSYEREILNDYCNFNIRFISVFINGFNYNRFTGCHYYGFDTVCLYLSSIKGTF